MGKPGLTLCGLVMLCDHKFWSSEVPGGHQTNALYSKNLCYYLRVIIHEILKIESLICLGKLLIGNDIPSSWLPMNLKRNIY